MLYQNIKKFYLLFRLWSLDVVLGSLAIGVFFTKILNVNMPLWWWFVLPVSVWIIYTADHLLDGFKTEGSDTAIHRHFYHYKNKKRMLIAMTVAVVANILLVSVFASPKIVFRGLALGFIVGLYFLLVHYFKNFRYFFYQKELVIAVIYISGILLGPLTVSNKPLLTWQIIIILVLVLLAWAEGIMASWFDFENDIHDNHISFTTVFGKQKTRYFLIALHILIFVILKINIFFITDIKAFISIIIPAIMNLLLLLILLNPEKMEINDRFRIAGEMVFWIPIIILFSTS